jgi:hypothetical protein
VMAANAGWRPVIRRHNDITTNEML